MAEDKKNSEEKQKSYELILSNAPHIKDKQSLSSIMWLVVAALIPSCAYSVYIYGINTLILLIAGVASAILAEWIFQYFMKRPVTCLDGSAAITGLLVAMNVPPESPVWMVVIGSFFAILIVKQIFGGIGFNIFNPALAARAFMIASWPVHMTTEWHPFNGTNVLAQNITNISNLPQKAYDTITMATPLGALKEGPKIMADLEVPVNGLYELLFSNDMLQHLFMGNIGGVIGETSALFILIGGLFLLIKRIITWHIPVSYIGTMGVIMLIYYLGTGFPFPFKATLFHLLSGGLILGAFFMATDMVTSPVTGKGMIIFGIGCGVIASVIRLWGGYPEGVSYSILLMNAAVPLIDRYMKPRVFGTTKNKEKE